MVYIDYWFDRALLIIMISVLVLLVFTVATLVGYMLYDSSQDGYMETDLRPWLKWTFIAWLIAITPFIAYDLITTPFTREFKGDIQELRIKYGYEDYHLVIKNKDNEIVFEKTGYFEYTKENNQITIYDKITKATEIVAVDDDMEIKFNIVAER